jgi:hypothetical protein
MLVETIDTTAEFFDALTRAKASGFDSDDFIDTIEALCSASTKCPDEMEAWVRSRPVEVMDFCKYVDEHMCRDAYEWKSLWTLLINLTSAKGCPVGNTFAHTPIATSWILDAASSDNFDVAFNAMWLLRHVAHDTVFSTEDTKAIAAVVCRRLSAAARDPVPWGRSTSTVLNDAENIANVAVVVLESRDVRTSTVVETVNRFVPAVHAWVTHGVVSLAAHAEVVLRVLTAATLASNSTYIVRRMVKALRRTADDNGETLIDRLYRIGAGDDAVECACSTLIVEADCATPDPPGSHEIVSVETDASVFRRAVDALKQYCETETTPCSRERLRDAIRLLINDYMVGADIVTADVEVIARAAAGVVSDQCFHECDKEHKTSTSELFQDLLGVVVEKAPEMSSMVVRLSGGQCHVVL